MFGSVPSGMVCDICMLTLTKTANILVDASLVVDKVGTAPFSFQQSRTRLDLDSAQLDQIKTLKYDLLFPYDKMCSDFFV